MFTPVFSYLAAGAATLGGVGSGVYLLQRGARAAAAQLGAQDRAAMAEALRGEVDLARLRQEALAAGVDTELVEQGYRNLRDDQITLDQVHEICGAWLKVSDASAGMSR